MITRRLLTHKKLLTHYKPLLNASLHLRPHSSMSTISQFVRKFMNRIRFEDNRALQAAQDKVSIQVLQTTKQVQQKFIGDQKFKSVVEKQRMQKIDQIIGTRTYFHETKMYQQRVDSDHVMLIEELAKKHPQPRRENLNWQNPQAPEQYKIKSTRKFYRNLKNLRQYPRHNYRISNFADEQSQENIQFLGKQSLFSKLSLKWVDTYQKSLQNQTVDDVSYELQSHRYSPMYVYFSTTYNSSKLYRVPCNKYTAKLLNSVTAFEEVKAQIEEVVSLEEIYETLKEYFHDERVTQWLKKVENGNIQYMLSGYKTSKEEDSLVVWVDLLGTKKEYVHIYKKLRKAHQIKQQQPSTKQTQQQHIQTKPQQQQNHITTSSNQQTTHLTQFTNKVVFNCKPSAVFSQSNQSIFMIQRSEQGGFVQLIQVPITQNHGLGRGQVLYKCKPYEEMNVWCDQGQGYLFLKVTEIGEVFREKVYIVEERIDGEGIELIEVVNQGLAVKKEQNQAEHSNNRQSEQARSQTQKQTQTNKTEQQSKTTTQTNKKSPSIKKSRISVSSCVQGLIVSTFYPTEDYFKYGSSHEYATSINLIPFKKHIQMQQQSSQRVNRQFQLSGKSFIKNKPSARQLDFGNRTVLYECPQEQFITEVSVRQSHVIISLSTISIYTKKRLLFIPYQQSKNPHSLVFSSLKLSFVTFGYNYSSQVLNFMLNRSPVLSEYYQYTIWKKELKQMTSDNVYIEKTRVNQNIQLTCICLNKFLQHLPKFYKDQQDIQHEEEDLSQQQQTNKYKLQNSQVPILIYLTDNNNNQINSNNKTSELNLRKLLQKGTMIITISSRGTLTSDLITFYKGSGQNFQNMIEDLKESIQWVGNNLGANISLYAKGNISALAGIMLNVRHPFLLTSTVLHDGAYDVMGKNVNCQQLKYFTQFYNEKVKKEEIEKYWQLYSPASFSFKRSLIATQKTISEQPHQNTSQNAQESQSTNQQSQPITLPTNLPQLQPIQQKIGTLQNIILSCSPSSYAKNQARRMIYHLRRNPNFKYDEVFLKEFLQGEDEELFNLSYIYGKMKERLEMEH